MPSIFSGRALDDALVNIRQCFTPPPFFLIYVPIFAEFKLPILKLVNFFYLWQ